MWRRTRRLLNVVITPGEAADFLAEVVGGAKGLPRASLFQKTIGNQATRLYLRTACPGFFDLAQEEVPRGATAGLEILTASLITDEFMTVLSNCAEKKFFDQFKKSTGVLGDKFSWKLDRIHSAHLDSMFGIIGAQRGDSMKGKQFVELMGQHFVVSPEFAQVVQIPDFRKRASKSIPYLFADGAMVRARVMITVDQTVTLPTVNEAGELDEAKTVSDKNIEHMVSLEISLTPRIGKKQMLSADSLLELTSEDPMAAGNWLITDINFSLSDNYPLDPLPLEENDEDGEEKPKAKKDEKNHK